MPTGDAEILKWLMNGGSLGILGMILWKGGKFLGGALEKALSIFELGVQRYIRLADIFEETLNDIRLALSGADVAAERRHADTQRLVLQAASDTRHAIAGMVTVAMQEIIGHVRNRNVEKEELPDLEGVIQKATSHIPDVNANRT